MFSVRVFTQLPRLSARHFVLIRTLHASPTSFLSAQTKGTAPPASRDAKEHTLLDQNPHLKHAVSSTGGNTGRDSGHGNTACEPELPSKKREMAGKQAAGAKEGEKTTKGGKRGLHTSATRHAEKHSADHYSKEVDMNAPASTKTHRVDGEGEMHRPNEQYTDPDKEYATVSRDEPYELAAEDNGSGTGREKPEQKDQKLRYGGTNRDSLRNAPRPNEGPDKADSGGRKPEGRN
ncbi:hypothetical protein EW145_g1550 [Phellinidium pouzarii]|uniref:Uncharacterized protein n=1 Tax=Phellinidium pouzarii TaxID=167371 RepID=A0A4S4LG03_9AGAM|nr:hypothetical protein EW145_g1550 [Phellinidium pouzarii]